MKKCILAVMVFMLAACATGQKQNTQTAQNISSGTQNMTFSVGPDETLNYPPSLTTLPDEHTTFFQPTAGSDTYTVFAATFPKTGGAVVLGTEDLKTFTFPAGYSSSAPVMSPTLLFTKCKPSFDPQFDLNYSAPGSVVQDPTRSPGNLIMIYEAENHCPGGVWQQPFYATVGIARSSDNGKTWPQPVDSELGGTDRYVALKPSVPEPTTAEQPPMAMGDALPSAFVDGKYLYVTYSLSGPGHDGFVRVARAALGGSGPLSFSKWYQGAFSQPGVGGLDSGMLPSKGCNGYQLDGQISYSDPLAKYLFTFVCVSYQKDANGTSQPTQAAWYFSTATSLDTQNWTDPQMIQNSEFPAAGACGSDGNGTLFDGWYPSFMSPKAALGHLSKEGQVFFMNGCNIGKRTFMSRTFTITVP